MKYLAVFLLFLIPIIAASAQVSDYVTGQIIWKYACFRLGNGTSSATIQVIDPDMNKFPSSTDTVSIFVHSDSSPDGVDLTLYETEADSGIFARTFGISNQRTAPNILYTQEGDTITAEYIDTTTPSQKQGGIKIVETAFIGCSSPPLERVPASDARITNSTGSTINHPMVGKQVQIQSDIANGQNREQKFAWITQIADEQDKIVSVGWITGMLNTDSSFSPSISWIPQKEGKYTATVFVWESLDNPTALSPPISIDFEVSKDQDAKKTTITHSLPLPPVTITIAESVTLGLHQSAIINDKDIQVMFSKINEDSRCQSGVACIWEGTVSVQLDIKTERGSEHLALSLQNNTAKINDKYSVKLVDVKPYPANDPILEQDYTVTLQIVQAESWRALTSHTVKVFDGKAFSASEPLGRKTGVNDTLTFMGMQFTHPSFPKIANPAGFISTTVTFADGVKETMGTNDPSRTFPVFTQHLGPQAGLVMNQDGTLSLLVSMELTEVSPLEQFKSGIPIDQIQCKEGFLLVKKKVNLPACIYKSSLSELIFRRAVDCVGDCNVRMPDIADTGEVKAFLAKNPNAKSYIDDSMAVYEKSGFRTHPSSDVVYQTKRLVVTLNGGKPVSYSAECNGGGVGLSGPADLLADPDWCFPQNQTQFEKPIIVIQDDEVNPQNSIPKKLDVVLGVNNVVYWKNQGSVTINIVSDDGSWETGMIKPDESASVTFNETGNHHYHGEPPPWLRGSISVIEK